MHVTFFHAPFISDVIAHRIALQEVAVVEKHRVCRFAADVGGMGGAVSFVMLVASVCAFSINILLNYVGAEYLRIISYILVIASTVQLVEMLMRKLTDMNIM